MATRARPRYTTPESAVVLLLVTGRDHEEDDEPETFQPAPHPDDRLWRHPSEIAAMHAAQRAETVQVPAIVVEDEASRSRLHVGLRVAAGLVVVGATALTLGVVSGDGASIESQVAGILPVAAVPADGPSAASSLPRGSTTEIAVEANVLGEDQLADRVHTARATSLPRIQAATSSGMREGSGLFVTDDGHIATSAGLIDSADYLLVWTEDGQRLLAELVASDPVSDVAVIQIEGDEWPVAPLDTGTDLWSGQYALTIDHQYDEISIGEITAVNGPLLGLDQPAAVPGSAVLDDTGSVIAMVTADGSNAHATPAWRVEQITEDLLSTGSTTHTFLGVVVETAATREGVVSVQEVIIGSPADVAGIQAGDLIDSLNGSDVQDAADLFRLVQLSEPGDDAVLTVTRHGNRRLIIAELGELD